MAQGVLALLLQVLEGQTVLLRLHVLLQAVEDGPREAQCQGRTTEVGGLEGVELLGHGGVAARNGDGECRQVAQLVDLLAQSQDACIVVELTDGRVVAQVGVSLQVHQVGEEAFLEVLQSAREAQRLVHVHAHQHLQLHLSQLDAVLGSQQVGLDAGKLHVGSQFVIFAHKALLEALLRVLHVALSSLVARHQCFVALAGKQQAVVGILHRSDRVDLALARLLHGKLHLLFAQRDALPELWGKQWQRSLRGSRVVVGLAHVHGDGLPAHVHHHRSHLQVLHALGREVHLREEARDGLLLGILLNLDGPVGHLDVRVVRKGNLEDLVQVECQRVLLSLCHRLARHHQANTQQYSKYNKQFLHTIFFKNSFSFSKKALQRYIIYIK